jgi:biopolymer transport protein ExbB/TolQ
MSALAHHFEEGGWGMYLILFWQVLAIGIIVERAIYLYKASINREVFLATMQKCILAGDIGRAIKLCSAANAPLARIVKAGLMKVNRPGLLGTVTGLIIAFGAVANADAASKATMLAKGISEAMNCTAFGLISAIIALIGFAAHNNKTQKLLDDINAATVQVVNLVVNNRSKIHLDESQAA